MRLRLALGVFSALLAAGAGGAQEPLPSVGGPVQVNPSGTPGKATGARTLRVSATVYRIDVPTRIVVLENEYGGYETIKVGPAVTGLDRIAPGDRVTVELQQGLALELQPPGTEFVPPSSTETVDASPHAKGAMGLVRGDMRATVTITKVDARSRIVTFQGPGGNVYRVKAGPAVKLDRVKPGDTLLATYTETIALTLAKQAPR